jgi:hypothetical protein
MNPNALRIGDSVSFGANLLPLTKDQLPNPLSAKVTDNPKRVIYWNHRCDAISEINKEVRAISLFDCGVYPSTLTVGARIPLNAPK